MSLFIKAASQEDAVEQDEGGGRLGGGAELNDLRHEWPRNRVLCDTFEARYDFRRSLDFGFDFFGGHGVSELRKSVNVFVNTRVKDRAS